ncbi:hypothetical protein [Amycolatopsis anabasis]|uniref:hypothetical protein n=1 Tax=Amycolatopsis anabasis TaxID=1840409 RepID=UPI00131D9DF7|nr:hypothetical protein [Amycolatopsis anabasis]
MIARPPAPLDVTELVVRRLRTQLAGQAAEGVKVSTETGDGPDGGPPSLPWLLVAEDVHTWDWPAVQRAVIRLTCWHRTPYTSKALVGLALGLLCAPPEPGSILWAHPVSAPIAGIDPHTSAPLATASAAVYARTPS